MERPDVTRTIKIPRELYRELQIRAGFSGRSIQGEIIHLLEHAITLLPREGNQHE